MHKTGSQISSTRRTERRPATRGFTLAEVLIAFGLASILMTGIMTTFLMMGRSGQLAHNYTELEVEARRALETFSRDARMANGVTSYGNSTVTFSIPDTTSSRTAISHYVTYTFDTTNQVFKRETKATPTGSATATSTMVKNVEQIGTTPFIQYFRYVGASTGYVTGFTTNYASSAAEIKQVELTFIAKRTSTTVATATDKVLSARFILRNR